MKKKETGMLPHQTDQKQQKMVNLFIKLSEVTGFISKKESLSTQHRLRTTMGRAKGELQDLIRKHKIDPELAKMLWQIVQKAPALYKVNVEGEDISIQNLNPIMQRQVFLAEELVKNQMVPLQEINNSLAECQENPSLNLGQVLLRKRLITSEQFVELNRKVQASSQSRIQKLAFLSLKQHQNKIFLNNSNTPKAIGNYEIICEIARGGMGVVYQAKDPHLDKVVALKTIIAGEAADSIDIERFRREAKLTSQLEHPNIVKIHEVGLQENLHYYTMDFVDGVSLSEYVKENKPPLRKLLKIILQVAESLGAAHSKGIIHRDIKPSNILVDKSGKPFLTDFGLARQQGGKDGLTMSGVAIGTPAYMSPEQAEGRIREIDQRSDIYSLGAVFYELLCGKPPFTGNSLAETLQMILTKEPMRLKQEVPSLPLKVETICLKCLKKNRNHRYTNAKALIRDIERFLKGDEIKAKRSGISEATTRVWTDHKNAVITAFATSLLFLGVFVVMYMSFSEQQTQYSKINKKLLVMTENLNKYKDQASTLAIERDILKNRLAESVQGSNLNVEMTNNELALLFNEAGVAQLSIVRQPAMAVKTFDKSIACNPKLWVAYLNKAKSFIALQQLGKAMESLSIIIDNRANVEIKQLLEAYNQRSFCFYNTQRFEEALKDINTCINQSPQASFFHKRGIIKVALGNPTSGLEDLNRAIKAEPHITYLYTRGKLLFDAKKYREAKIDLQRCKAADPRYNAPQIQEMLLTIARYGY